VSKVTKRHCAGTVHQSQGRRVWNVKQVGFESRPEDSTRGWKLYRRGHFLFTHTWLKICLKSKTR